MANLEQVPTDLGVFLLEFLELDDLDQVACVSRRFLEMRNNSVLDPTRTGTIRILGPLIDRILGPVRSTTFTLEDFILKIPSWQSIFQGNKRRMRIEGAHHIIMRVEIRRFESMARGEIQLTGVTCLEVAVDRPTKMHAQNLWTMALMVPNLTELTLNGVSVSSPIVNWFARYCPNLRCLTWEDGKEELTRHQQSLDLPGNGLRLAHNLRELYLRGSLLYCTNADEMYLFRLSAPLRDGSNSWIFHKCPTLERIDLEGVTYLTNSQRFEGGKPQKIPQEGLIKLVRNSPNLTWFRSDLTAENVEMLQTERPEVTFVSPTEGYSITEVTFVLPTEG